MCFSNDDAIMSATSYFSFFPKEKHTAPHLVAGLDGWWVVAGLLVGWLVGWLDGWLLAGWLLAGLGSLVSTCICCTRNPMQVPYHSNFFCKFVAGATLGRGLRCGATLGRGLSDGIHGSEQMSIEIRSILWNYI